MWFRVLLIMLIVYLVMRNLVKLLHPKDAQRNVRGTSQAKSGRIDESRIQDASYRDLPNK